jgi:hypothetical protein
MPEEALSKSLNPEELQEVANLQNALSELRYQIGELEGRKFALLNRESTVRVALETSIHNALQRLDWPQGQPYAIHADGTIYAK